MARLLIVLALVFVAVAGLASATAPAAAPTQAASAPAPSASSTSASSPSSSESAAAPVDETASAPIIADSPMNFAPEGSLLTADDSASSAGALKISGVVAVAAVAGFFSL